MRKIILLILIVAMSCFYACSNMDKFGDTAANGGNSQTPGDGSTNPSVTHVLSYQDGLTVQYKATAVNISNMTDVSYEWDLGDGTYSTNASAEISHTYKQEGTYNVTVKVKSGEKYIAEYTNPYTIYAGASLVNNVLMAEPDKTNKLRYYFYTSASSNDEINFAWDFGDDSGSVSTGNVNTTVHTFPKYGKTYPVTVTSNTGSDSNESSVLINIPGVTIDMKCSTSGLAVICNPVLPSEIPDMEIKWDCGNGKEPIITKGEDVVVCQYDDNATDVTIKIEGNDDKLEGTVNKEQDFTVSKMFSMQVVERKATSSDKLSWQINVNGDLKAKEGTDLSQYKVQYRFDYGDGNGFGEWKNADSNYDIVDSYTFSKYPANGQTGYNVVVQAQVLKDSLDPEVSRTNTTFNISAPVGSLTRENITNSEGFGQKFCVKWDYVPAGSLKYTWNFGDQQGNAANDGDGQCQTHIYKQTGKYDITVDITSNDSKFSSGYVKQVKGSVTFQHDFTGLDTPITITPNESNPLSYTISSNVKSSASDGSGGEVGSGELEYTWEINTGTETVTKTGQSITQVFPKYGKNYPINLTVKLKGTDISTERSSQVAISTPVLAISTANGIINLGQQSSWTSSIKYDNKDIVLSNGFNPTYSWSVTDGGITTNGQSTLNHTFKTIGKKTVTLSVTSSQLDETLTATGSVEVIQPVTLESAKFDCSNDKWDAVKYTCTGKLFDQNGGEITDSAYSIEWKVAEVGISKTSQPSKSVNLILDWPPNKFANQTPTRTFKAEVIVKKDGSQVKKESKELSVTRAITYTANIQGYSDNGFNRKAVINFSNIQGPEISGNIKYNWKYYFENSNGAKDTNTFSTAKNPGSKDFNFVLDNIHYIGSVKGNPFAGGNGIGLKIEGLSKPLEIYGVADNYAVFGPDFSINTGKSIVFQRRPNNGTMVGITGNSGWFAYAFAHNFVMNKPFKAGSYPHALKVEIHQDANVKHFNTNNGDGVVVSYFTVGAGNGTTTTSQYLGFQSSYAPVNFPFSVDIYGYHTSSDAKKDGSKYIKMGEAIYQYDNAEQFYGWRF